MPKFTFGGGINQLNDIEIPPSSAIGGQNFELGLANQKLKPRPPFDLLDTTPNVGNIHGLHQLVERDGTKTTLVMSGTQAYTWDGSAFATVGPALNASSRFFDFDWPLDETIVIVDRNKTNVVLEWDGTTLAALTTGLGVDFFAKYGLVADNRAWFANITDGTVENPHMLVASAFENRQSLDTSARGGTTGTFTTGLEAFYLLTPDLRPINGLIEFKNVIIISTEGGRLFKLVGDDATNYKFERFYAGSAAIGDDSFGNVGDDVYYMRKGGVIESLRSTDTFGDVGVDDLSLPVLDEVKDSMGTQIIYDQTNKKVFFFLPSKLLVLFKDLLKSDESPFTVYKTTHPSSFNTDAVRYMEFPESTSDASTVIFGDDSGNLYNLNGSGVNGDAGTDEIEMIRRLPLHEFDYSTFFAGRIGYRRLGQCDLNMGFSWGDERNETSLTVTLKGITGVSPQNYYGGAKYYNGGNYYSEGIVGGGNPVTKGFSAIGKGTSVFVTLGITTNERYEIDFLSV